MLSDIEIEALAQDHVRRTDPADFELLYCEKRRDPDGIYFVANRAEKPTIGPGGFFVDRATGEIWSFGSGQIVHEGLDYWLKWYADGWRPGNYQLVVHGVKNPSGFAKLLVKHGVTYLVRTVEHGTVWRDSVDYDENTVLVRLTKLPCTFAMNAKRLSEMLPVLRNDELVDFDYSYIGPAGKYDWRPENNAPEQMGPQWEEPG